MDNIKVQINLDWWGLLQWLVIPVVMAALITWLIGGNFIANHGGALTGWVIGYFAASTV